MKLRLYIAALAHNTVPPCELMLRAESKVVSRSRHTKTYNPTVRFSARRIDYAPRSRIPTKVIGRTRRRDDAPLIRQPSFTFDDDDRPISVPQPRILAAEERVAALSRRAYPKCDPSEVDLNHNSVVRIILLSDISNDVNRSNSSTLDFIFVPVRVSRRSARGDFASRLKI